MFYTQLLKYKTPYLRLEFCIFETESDSALRCMLESLTYPKL